MREYDRVDKGGYPLGLKSTLYYIDVYPTFAYYSNKVWVKENDEGNNVASLALSNYWLCLFI